MHLHDSKRYRLSNSTQNQFCFDWKQQKNGCDLSIFQYLNFLLSLKCCHLFTRVYLLIWGLTYSATVLSFLLIFNIHFMSSMRVRLYRNRTRRFVFVFSWKSYPKHMECLIKCAHSHNNCAVKCFQINFAGTFMGWVCHTSFFHSVPYDNQNTPTSSDENNNEQFCICILCFFFFKVFWFVRNFQLIPDYDTYTPHTMLIWNLKYLFTKFTLTST